MIFNYQIHMLDNVCFGFQLSYQSMNFGFIITALQKL